MDGNAGDYFPSFMKMNGLDHLVLYGRAPSWTLAHIRDGRLDFGDASPYVGLDNIDLRDRIATDFGGVWTRDLAMANITRAGENRDGLEGNLADSGIVVRERVAEADVRRAIPRAHGDRHGLGTNQLKAGGTALQELDVDSLGVSLAVEPDHETPGLSRACRLRC